MGMHAGSNGDLRSNIPWSFGSFCLKLVSPMCWSFPAAFTHGYFGFQRGFCFQLCAEDLQIYFFGLLGPSMTISWFIKYMG